MKLIRFITIFLLNFIEVSTCCVMIQSSDRHRYEVRRWHMNTATEYYVIDETARARDSLAAAISKTWGLW